jgi:uncharacterized membrane protein
MTSFTLSKPRFEAFTDGVFAIAITLLVLEFRLPSFAGSPSEAEQVRALVDIWPQYLVYFASFATIGIMWLNHHAQFRYIEKITYGMALANLFLLLLICFLPFATEVLARFGITRTTAVYYGLTLFAISIGYSAVQRQVLAVYPQLPQGFTAYNLVGLLLYPAATLLAYFFPLGGIVAYVLLALFYMLPGNVRRAALRPDTPGDLRH